MYNTRFCKFLSGMNFSRSMQIQLCVKFKLKTSNINKYRGNFFQKNRSIEYMKYD